MNKNVLYKNIEAEISKILRICQDCTEAKIFFQTTFFHVENLRNTKKKYLANENAGNPISVV